ncbi:MAG: methyltransferase domain-containing protein [Nitrosomonas sp.]|nr:methyltransferase domain-containing protein [Nitrosomonas sp.]
MQTNVSDTRFNIIAESYEYAIATYPDARRDGDWLLNQLDVQVDDKILEISAGTGFLTEQIVKKNTAGKLFAQDIAPKTLDLNKAKCGYYKHLEYTTEVETVPDNYCDKAVSLGGWHHMVDQIGVTKSALRKLKEGGYFCVGDFSDNSSIQRYFDEVIDKITVTGHQGLFPSKSRMINIGRFVHAQKTEVEEFDVEFKFDTKEGIGEFFQRVFALDQNPSQTYSDIEKYFEIKRIDHQLAVMIPYIYAKYIK